MRKLASGAALLASSLVLVACGDGTPTAARPDAGARYFRGAALSDTLGSGLAQTGNASPSEFSDSAREGRTERGGFIGSGH
jgi:hypothetical protein